MLKVTQGADGKLKINDNVVPNGEIIGIQKNNDYSTNVTIVLKADIVVFASSKEYKETETELLNRFNL